MGGTELAVLALKESDLRTLLGVGKSRLYSGFFDIVLAGPVQRAFCESVNLPWCMDK